jgi:hypothetical protein
VNESGLPSALRNGSPALFKRMIALSLKKWRLEARLGQKDAARKAKNWWTAMSGAVPKWFDLFLGRESGAAELHSFDTVVVPGLLQTPEYAMAAQDRVSRGFNDLAVMISSRCAPS